VTFRLRPRLSACPLPLSLVGARLGEIAPTPGPSESPVAGLSADFPADPLRVARRGLRDKGRAALGTSAKSRQRRAGADHGRLTGRQVDHVATAGAGPVTRPRGSRSGREVDQRNAAAEVGK
jgi:hypothetical protein